MESSALNVAHQQHRRAEAHVQFRRYDEAVVCHRKAAENLGEAMKATTFPRSLESMQLQRDYHLRQEEIVRTMEEADSLLDLLVMRRGTDSDTDSDHASECEQLEVRVEDVVAGATKRPKDDRTVIEELRTLNQQLRALVYQLVTQLDICAGEADALRDRVRVLEAEHTREESVRKTSLHVITDSVGGNSSPFVFSPCSELSPEVTDPRPVRELPSLAPLEMPSFDFSVFTKSSVKEGE